MINVTAAAENCRYSVEEIKAFADVKTTTSWESMAGSQGSRRKRREQLVSPPEEPKRAIVDPSRDLRLDPATLDKMLRGACDALIQAEPDLTKCESQLAPLICCLVCWTAHELDADFSCWGFRGHFDG